MMVEIIQIADNYFPNIQVSVSSKFGIFQSSIYLFRRLLSPANSRTSLVRTNKGFIFISILFCNKDDDGVQYVPTHDRGEA